MVMSKPYVPKFRKAKIKTVRMTWSIVLFFLLCWTPYYAAATLHFIDIDYKVPFIMSLKSSIIIEIVYRNVCQVIKKSY